MKYTKFHLKDETPTRARQPAALSVATALARAFRAHGVKRMFGLPGGGSSLDLIEAGRRERIPFVLARHECAAVFMAAATAEIEGSPGVALTTIAAAFPASVFHGYDLSNHAIDRAEARVAQLGLTNVQLH